MKLMFDHHKVKLPSKRALEKKVEQHERLPKTSVTDVRKASKTYICLSTDHMSG